MKVFLEWDDKQRVRIGQEHLDSHSHGPGYGGTGAIRLQQVMDRWFFAYRLDDHAPRGTAALHDGDFNIIKAHLPSAQKAGPQLTGIIISEEDLHELFEMTTDTPTPRWLSAI